MTFIVSPPAADTTAAAAPAAPAETPNPIQAAIAAAAEQFPDAGLATPDTDPPADGTQEQPRGADGRFISPEAAAAAPVDATAPPADPNAPAEEDAGGEEPYVFSITPDEDGAAPVEVELGGLPPEVRAELDRLQHTGLRAVDYHQRVADVDAQRAEMQEFEEELAANPVGVLMDHLPANVRADVVRALLAQDDTLYQQINEMLLDWDTDPSERITAAQTLQQDLTARANKVREDLAADRVARTAAQAVWKGVLALVPAGARDEDASDFLADSHAFLMREMNQRDIAPQDVPALLARRVTRYFSGKPGAPSPLAAATPASEDAAELARRAEAARGTGKRFVQTAVRRREAAATAPAGAGGGPANLALPKGTDLKTAINLVRQRGGL